LHEEKPTMQTARQWDAKKQHLETYATVLGKLLAVGLILAPLAMMLFPELNHRSGNTSGGRQDTPATRSLTSEPSLVPEPFSRNDK
jgi:hypothetical protein